MTATESCVASGCGEITGSPVVHRNDVASSSAVLADMLAADAVPPAASAVTAIVPAASAAAHRVRR
ncbi:hypothetical protein JCM11754A_37520 [Isoptericola variabilis]